jgi:HEPN domain-containing protein
MSKNRANDWLSQAEDDFFWMTDTLENNRFAQACFIAQQVAEKSLKALALLRGYEQIRSHSVVEIARELKINSEIESYGKILDLYYISARYPDALPSGFPSDRFTREQADDAVKKSSFILEQVKHEFS